MTEQPSPFGDPTAPAAVPDPTQGRVVLLVIGLVGAITLVGLAGVIACVMSDRELPEALVALVAAGLSALSTFLVTTRTSTTPSGTPPP